eukprot:478760_1
MAVENHHIEDDEVGLDAVGQVINLDEQAELEEELSQFSLGLKKKKKKKKKKVAVIAADEEEKKGEGMSVNSDGTYGYPQTLSRIYALLFEKNPNLQSRRTYKMVPPQLGFVGSKKTLWSNFREVCDLMHRSQDHVMSYFMIELGTQGSLDKNNRMLIKGRFRGNHVQNVLKKYISEYVRCMMCHTPETILERDQITRLYFLRCNNCGSNRSVAPIKTLFQATSKADRRQAKKTAV